jgi:hypothetical protein
MEIDYQLIVNKLRADLENLAEQDAEFRKKVNLKDNSSMICQHRAYISALNDTLKAQAERYRVGYKPIQERFP